MSENYRDQVYIGTVLLEHNRWAKVRTPSFAVSEWLGRFADAGFDGIELWQNHALLADDNERDRLRNSGVPVRIFNAYASCDAEALDQRRAATEMAGLLGAEGMKFNFGKDPMRHDEYVDSVKTWRESLAENFRFLCECHGGTTMQDPAKAVDAFEALSPGRYEVIIHGFGGDESGIRRAFKYHGSRITHIHANLSSNGPMTEGEVRARIDLLRELGFCGSFTIEFTEGVGSDDEEIEALFANASRDKEMLVRCLDR